MMKKSALLAFLAGTLLIGNNIANATEHGQVYQLQSGISYEYTLDNNDANGVNLVNEFPFKVKASCVVSGENTLTDILISVTKGGGKINDIDLKFGGNNNFILPVSSHQKSDLLALGNSSVNLKNVGTMPVTAVCKVK